METSTGIAILAFNVLNGLMVCVAISVAGLGAYVWHSRIPDVSTLYETAVQAQGLFSAILGGFVSVAAWLGTFGVNNEKMKLVIAYKAVFGALVAPVIVLGVMTWVNMSKWLAVADDNMYHYMESYFNDTSFARVTDDIQLGYRCCGMEPLPKSYEEGKRLPFSCCDPLLTSLEQKSCEQLHKFVRTCNGVLTENLEKVLIWLTTLDLLLAIFFIALLADLQLIKFPLEKSPTGNTSDVQNLIALKVPPSKAKKKTPSLAKDNRIQ